MPLATVMSFFQNVYKVKVRKSLSHCLLMHVSVSHLILGSVIEYWRKTLFYRVSQLSVVDADADIEDELSTDSDTCAPRASWPPCCCSWGVYNNGITYWAERERERERETKRQRESVLICYVTSSSLLLLLLVSVQLTHYSTNHLSSGCIPWRFSKRYSL